MHTHSDRLVRWLGQRTVDEISFNMRDWYGPPIAVSGAPGVKACAGGDFVGELRYGYATTVFDYLAELGKRFQFAARNIKPVHGVLQAGGFADYPAFLASLKRGRAQTQFVVKTTSSSNSLCAKTVWRQGSVPAAGAAHAAAPGGSAPTSATTGAIPFANAISGQKTFFAGAQLKTDVACTLLMYDRIFGVAKTMNSTATEAVTGVPTRYQSSTGNAEGSAAGTFMFPDVTSNLAATAHNWTVCQYTNQDGTTGQTLPSQAGFTSQQLNIMDLPALTWFMPLAAGDSGVKAITQLQCDALVATGGVDFVLAHPIAWIPQYILSIQSIVDGVVGPFNFARVFDDAALSFLTPCQPTAIGTMTLPITFVQG